MQAAGWVAAPAAIHLPVAPTPAKRIEAQADYTGFTPATPAALPAAANRGLLPLVLLPFVGN
jgi:hypothetical protein